MKYLIKRLKNIWAWGAYVPVSNVPDNVDVGFSFTGTTKAQFLEPTTFQDKFNKSKSLGDLLE